MSTLRKLRRTGQMAWHKVEPLRDRQLLFARKMSEVLLDFAEPVLETFDHPEDFEAMITLATLCWNCSFLPANEQRKSLNNVINELVKSEPTARIEVEECIRILMERKKTVFANERRIITDFEVVEERDGSRLVVLSTLAED